MPARYFIAEGPNLYGKYLQGPVEWAEMLQQEELGEIYQGGYLPYSGDIRSPQHLFYKSRSLRVDLERYRLKKKRRYDHRKWENFALQRQFTDAESFKETYRETLLDMACKWMHPRFGEAALPRERLEYILSKPFLNGVLSWHQGGKLTAFALIVSGQWGAHYWYVFYENGAGRNSPPGHGYLVDFLTWCNSQNLPFAWLGTAYAGKSAYKSRGIEGISFWNGQGWSEDKTELSQLQLQDVGAGKSLLIARP